MERGKNRKPRARSEQARPEAAVERRGGSARVVAVTGAFGSFGRRVVERLESDPTVDRVVAIDIRGSSGGAAADPRAYLQAHTRLSAFTVDLTAPDAASELSQIFSSEGVGSVIHLAFLSTPSHALEMAHELETIGTMHVLHAIAAAEVGYTLSLSSAMCYGARPDNPAWITEDCELRPPASRTLRDRAEADRAVTRFGAEHPSLKVATARIGAVLGSAPDHFWTRTFARRVVPGVLGYDPLMQLMLVDDAAAALHAIWTARATGPFNVVGRGVLPLSHILTRLGRIPLYLPARLGKSLVGALWSAQLVDTPPRFLDYLRWSWVCDAARLHRETGFAPANDISTSLNMFASDRAIA